MKKNMTRWWVILGAVLVVYNVIVFAVPFPKNAVFFVSWLFTLAAIGMQVYVVRTAFYRGEGVKSKFYGWPIARFGVMYLAVQLALGLVFMALGFTLAVPVWLPLVLYVALLSVSAVGLIASDAMRDEIVRQDTALKRDVTCMRTLQSKAASMIQLAHDAAGKICRGAALQRSGEQRVSAGHRGRPDRLCGRTSSGADRWGRGFHTPSGAEGGFCFNGTEQAVQAQ